jgi:hypothetical protein
MNYKNPGYSVGVHCNIVIVVINTVGEVVKGNKNSFNQSINQSSRFGCKRSKNHGANGIGAA